MDVDVVAAVDGPVVDLAVVDFVDSLRVGVDFALIGSSCPLPVGVLGWDGSELGIPAPSAL